MTKVARSISSARSANNVFTGGDRCDCRADGARPIAVLNLEDEAGGDEKLVCVPVDSTFPYYSNVGEKDDLPEIVFEQIEHFFTHYKDLERKKWVRVGTWGGRDEARRITMEAVDRYNAAKNAGDEAPGMDKAEGEREEGVA